MKRLHFLDKFKKRSDIVSTAAVVNALWAVFAVVFLNLATSSGSEEKSILIAVFACLCVVQLYASYLVIIECRRPLTILLVNLSCIATSLFSIALPISYINQVKRSFEALGVLMGIVSGSFGFLEEVPYIMAHIMLDSSSMSLVAFSVFYFAVSTRILYLFNKKTTLAFYGIGKTAKK